MIGLLIITHESLGKAYSDLAKHFFPQYDFSHIRLLHVETHDDHESILARAQAILPELNQGYGVLILTDIFGATPCNAALKILAAPNHALLTGLNAPMLIKAVNYSNQMNDLKSFTEEVRAAAINGILMFQEHANP